MVTTDKVTLTEKVGIDMVTTDMGVTNEPINKRKDSIATLTLSEQVSALEKDANEFYLRLRYLEQAVLESSDEYEKIFKRANELYEKLENENV